MTRRKSLPVIVCGFCGDGFLPKAHALRPSNIAKRKSGMAFCSYSCASRYGNRDRLATLRWPELSDPEWLAEQASGPNSIKRIAGGLGCSRAVVANAYDAHGIARPVPPKSVGVKGPRGPVMARRVIKADDEEWLRARYVIDQWSLVRIAEEVGCGRGAVTNALRRLGIPVRSAEEQASLARSTNGGKRSAGARNRRMVTARGNSGPGRVLHFDGPVQS